MIGIIEKIALKICSDEGWYDMAKCIRRCRKFPIMVFFIVGERRIGKTLFLQRLACELFIQTGWQTMWMRNKKVELIEDGFTSGFLTACKTRGWCPESWVTKTDGVWTNDGKDPDNPPEQVFMFQSMSTFSNRRGNETPKVLLGVFDEFMPEDRKYPKTPAKALMSLSKTVFSGRKDARLVCLSNFISSANPYFVGFRVYPGKDPITVFPDKGICIEVCEGYRRAIAEDNPWNKVYEAGGYQDYATADEDTLTELVKKTPNGSKPMKYLILNQGLYYRGSVKDGIIYWSEYKSDRSGYVVYAVSLQEVGKDVYLMPQFMKSDIKTMTESNAIRFDNPNVMFGVLSCVYDAV